MDTAFCVDALDEALARSSRPKIFNTDRGSQHDPSLGVDVVQLGGGDQRVDRGGPVTTAIGTREQPAASAEGNTAPTTTITDISSGVIVEDIAGQPSNQKQRSSGPPDRVHFTRAIFAFSAASIFPLGFFIIRSVYHDGAGTAPINPLVPKLGVLFIPHSSPAIRGFAQSSFNEVAHDLTEASRLIHIPRRFTDIGRMTPAISSLIARMPVRRP